MQRDILKLFKRYLGDTTISINNSDGLSYMGLFNQRALKFGVMIPNNAPKEAIDEAIKIYGKDGVKWNSTFHKDFLTVATKPIEELIFQQIIHYFTTYGAEDLGMYDSDIVYLPKEKLEIPELEKDIELIVIRPITEFELENKLMTLLTSGIALSKDTITSILALSKYISKDRLEEIKNREVKISLYDKFGLVPEDPNEFLRYLIYKTTGETLKIQSVELISKIRDCDKEKALELFNKYTDMKKLSSIFLRNKKLFLAYKIQNDDFRNFTTNKNVKINLNKKINKLRKLANRNHHPLKRNILDEITNPARLNSEELEQALDNATIFREIRILNSLGYRINYPSTDQSIVYRIRNGKSYVSNLKDYTISETAILFERYNYIYNHLINRLKEKVQAKLIYIPDNITYMAPTSEKQFNNNIPNGSYLEFPNDSDLVYGVHWNNIIKSKSTTERVDLDLKQMNKNEVFGWDAFYRRSDEVLFSGDVTDAPLPDGATELFYVSKSNKEKAYLLTLNMYTANSEDVPFEFVIAKADKKQFGENYVVDSNNILEQLDMTIEKDNRQKVVGLITIGDKIRFYFNDFSAGASQCSSSNDDIMLGAFNYLKRYSECQIKLKPLLIQAGAIMTDSPTVTKTTVTPEGITTEEFPVDIDLSPNAITKETIIDLLS